MKTKFPPKKWRQIIGGESTNYLNCTAIDLLNFFCDFFLNCKKKKNNFFENKRRKRKKENILKKIY